MTVDEPLSGLPPTRAPHPPPSLSSRSECDPSRASPTLPSVKQRLQFPPVKPRLPLPPSWPLLAVGACLPLACGGGEEPGEDASAGPPVELPDSVAIADPTPLLENLEFVEEASELVADRLVELADKLRRRDFVGAADYLERDFAGHALDGLPVAAERTTHLETAHASYAVDAPRIVGAGDWLDSVQSWIGDWSRVEMVQWKVKGAEFARAVPRWGKAHFKISFLGDAPDGAPVSITAWGWGRMQFTRGLWQLARFELESLDVKTRSAPLFTEVSTSTGLAHVGIRFGQEGNDSFAWNGAAGGDADGDGLWDLYLPSRPKNFLYMSAPRWAASGGHS